MEALNKQHEVAFKKLQVENKKLKENGTDIIQKLQEIKNKNATCLDELKELRKKNMLLQKIKKKKEEAELTSMLRKQLQTKEKEIYEMNTIITEQKNKEKSITHLNQQIEIERQNHIQKTTTIKHTLGAIKKNYIQHGVDFKKLQVENKKSKTHVIQKLQEIRNKTATCLDELKKLEKKNMSLQKIEKKKEEPELKRHNGKAASNEGK